MNCLLVLLMTLVATSTAQQLLRSEKFAVGKTTILYQQLYAKGKVYFHYNAGNGWNSVPGLEMKPSSTWAHEFPQEKGWYEVQVPDITSTFEFDFVTDDGTQLIWDNNEKRNYWAYEKGTWALSSPFNPQPVQVQNADGNLIRVLFQRPASWGQGPTYIHYREGTGAWTTLPGVKATESKYLGFYANADYRNSADGQLSTWDYSYFGWVQFDFHSSSSTSEFEFTFNDGFGNWDNNRQHNFKISQPGVWAFLPTAN